MHYFEAMRRKRHDDFVNVQKSGSNRFVYILDFLCKGCFIIILCNLRTLFTCRLTPLRILQNGIQQLAKLFLGFVFKTVASFKQDIFQTGIAAA